MDSESLLGVSLELQVTHYCWSVKYKGSIKWKETDKAGERDCLLTCLAYHAAINSGKPRRVLRGDTVEFEFDKDHSGSTVRMDLRGPRLVEIDQLEGHPLK